LRKSFVSTINLIVSVTKSLIKEYTCVIIGCEAIIDVIINIAPIFIGIIAILSIILIAKLII